MSKVFSGIGSRSCPPEVCNLMTQIAAWLAEQGYWCRTGAADGADLAFGRGAGNKTIYYLPWSNYNEAKIFAQHPTINYPDNPNCIIGCETASPEAIAIAKTLHPNPEACSDSVWKLHGRNCHIINGAKLDSPSEFVLYWCPEVDNQPTGGTAMGVNYAKSIGVPTLSLAGAMKSGAPDIFEYIKTCIINIQYSNL